ncbi:MAG: hypothetical protein ACLVEJ_24085 [Parabacteroides sp.]
MLSKDQGGADVLSLVQKLQPNAIAFQGPYGHPNLIRWVGNEEGVAPYPCWSTADSTTNADGTRRHKWQPETATLSAPFWRPGNQISPCAGTVPSRAAGSGRPDRTA